MSAKAFTHQMENGFLERRLHCLANLVHDTLGGPLELDERVLEHVLHVVAHILLILLVGPELG